MGVGLPSGGLGDRRDMDKITDANSAGCNAGSLASRMVPVPLSQAKQDGFSQKEAFSRGMGSAPSSRKAARYGRLHMVDPQRGRGPSICSPDGAAGLPWGTGPPTLFPVETFSRLLCCSCLLSELRLSHQWCLTGLMGQPSPILQGKSIWIGFSGGER